MRTLSVPCPLLAGLLVPGCTSGLKRPVVTAEAREHRFSCHVDGRAKKGMTGTIVVVP